MQNLCPGHSSPADRCYDLLRSGGDVWAWLIDLNRQRFDRGGAPIVSYQELWIRLSRPVCYPPEQIRAITLLHDAGRLWLAVTAAIPVQRSDLDPARVAGVDLGIIHPYVRPAEGESANGLGGGSIAAAVHFKGIEIWSVPPTSPPWAVGT
jgi:hypothetical protein